MTMLSPALGVPEPLVENTRHRRRLQRMLPEVWQEQQAANQAVIEQILAQYDVPTAYESAAEGA